MRRSQKSSGIIFAVILFVVALVYAAQPGGTGSTAGDFPSQAAESAAPSQAFLYESAASTPSPDPVNTADDKPSPVLQPAAELTTLKTSDDAITVYITESGEKYHRAGCQYLSHSKISVTLNEAREQGYEPCSKCDPPQ